MKWSDLMPGDILEYTEEYIREVCPHLPGYWGHGKTFTIRTIQDTNDPDLVYITFNEVSTSDRFPMIISTGVDKEFDYLYNGPAFRIKKLAEDKNEISK